MKTLCMLEHGDSVLTPVNSPPSVLLNLTKGYVMPSASPMYTFSSVFTEPEAPFVLSHGSRITGNDNSQDGNANSSTTGSTSGGGSKNLYNMDTKYGNLSDTFTPCSIAEYDPFKCLSAMAEQSLTGNFTHTGQSTSSAKFGVMASRGVASSANSHRGGGANGAASHQGEMYTDIGQMGLFQTSSRIMYSSSSSSLSSSSPPLSPASSCYAYTATSDPGSSNDFLTNDNSSYHVPSQTNQNQSHNFLRNDSPFCHSPSNSNPARGGGNSRQICKKSYPSCSSEQSLEDNDRLLSWTRHHPENWSSSEVLDWLFFVAQERGMDMQEFRGENFQNINGMQLCQMGLGDFTRLEPRFGRAIYEMFKNLLCGVLFRKPVDPEHVTSQISSYSSLPCPSPQPSHGSLQGYNLSPPSYQMLETDINCNGIAPSDQFFKQEKCTNVQNSIDINSYDFDLDDTPCITNGQNCQDQFQPEYALYPAQYPQTTPMRTSCCFPPPPFSGQLPRRRPGRPRVKGLIDDERANKERKVKNQHLWEFIYETLMNPVYNPQYLRWENQRDGVFRFVQSEAVAQLWGGRKNNENMTYEKLSRAMRHYYRRGILERVEGRRLVYKFSLKAMERVREKRHNPV